MADTVTFADLRRITDTLSQEVLKAFAADRERIAELEEVVASLRRELEAHQ